MSYLIVKSVNLKSIDNIDLVSATKNIRPLLWRKTKYVTKNTTKAITMFIRDLDSQCIQLYKTPTNNKYIHELFRTRES